MPFTAVEVPRAIPNTRILTWTLGCYEPSVVNTNDLLICTFKQMMGTSPAVSQR